MENSQNSQPTIFQISAKHMLRFKWLNQNYRIQLKQSTEEEIIKLRLTRQPGFVIRDKNGKLYCAPIPNCTLVPKDPALMVHMCRNCGKCCQCDKVRDNSFEAYLSEGQKTASAMELSKRIEKYPFITLGYQVFNAAANNDFTVCSCKNFAHYRPKNKFLLAELYNS